MAEAPAEVCLARNPKYRPDLNEKGQQTVAGDGLPTARDAAIRLAVHLAAHPPIPKVGGKVCRRALTSHLLPVLSSECHAFDSPVCQRKERSKANEDETYSTRPAWVVCHNTYNLWQRGCNEAMMPTEVKFTAETAAQVARVREWAAAMAAQVEEQAAAEAEPLPPPRMPQGLVNVVAQAPTPEPCWRPPAGRQLTHFDPATLAQVAAIKNAPARVSGSPATVLDMQ